MVFLAGLFTGASAAWRWRLRSNMVEQIVLTPQRTSGVAQILFAGNLTVLATTFLAIGGTETLFKAFFPWTSPDLVSAAAISAPGPRIIPEGILSSFFFWPILYLALARFHFESMRLCHWIFAPVALPGPRLFGILVATFIGMALSIVLFGIVTFILVRITGSIILGLFGSSELTVMLSILIPVLTLTALKRLLSMILEYHFIRRLTLGRIHGFGEVGALKSFTLSEKWDANEKIREMELDDATELRQSARAFT